MRSGKMFSLDHFLILASAKAVTGQGELSLSAPPGTVTNLNPKIGLFCADSRDRLHLLRLIALAPE